MRPVRRPCPLPTRVKRARLRKGGAALPGSAEDDVEAPAAAVATVRAANCCNAGRMARRGQPIMNGGADLAALDRRLARSRMAGHEQQDALTRSDCPLQRLIDGLPRAVEAVAMEIERSVGLDRAGPETPIPTAVESCRLDCLSWRWRRRPGSSLDLRRFRRGGDRLGRNVSLVDRVAREWLDGRGYPRPERRLVRAERAHAQRRPWGAGCRRRHWRPCHPQCGSLPRHGPRMCRTGWHP